MYFNFSCMISSAVTIFNTSSYFCQNRVANEITILLSQTFDFYQSKFFVEYGCQKVRIPGDNYEIQEAFEKCWAHSPLRVASRPFTRCC